MTDVPHYHPDVPVQKNVIYDRVSGGTRKEMRVTAWEKSQELCSGKYTLWDHCFELPDTQFEAVRPVKGSVAVGQVTHHLKVGGNDKLEIFDYPGGSAQRFDGVDPGGSPRPADPRRSSRTASGPSRSGWSRKPWPFWQSKAAATAGTSAPGTSST